MAPVRALTLALPLAFAATGSAQTILLRYKPAAGVKVSYITATDMTQTVPGMAAPMSTHFVVPMTMRVLSRTATSTTMETKLGQAKVTMPAGSAMSSMKASLEKTMSGMTGTSVYGELGNVLSATGQASAMTGSMSGPALVFPRKAVRVGETWTDNLDLNKVMAGMGQAGVYASGKIPVQFHLVSLKKVGAKSLATISISIKGKTSVTMPNGKMDMNLKTVGVRTVDAATGMPVNTSLTSDNTMTFMGKDMVQHIVVSMKAN